MGWLALIALAVIVELLARVATKNMADKKRREKLLAFIWVILGITLIVIWLIMK